MTNPAQSYQQRQLELVRANLSSVVHLLDDPTVNEIQINAPGVVFARRGATDVNAQIDIKASEIQAAVQTIAAINDKEVASQFATSREERARNTLSARLPGLRIEAIQSPVAIRGPSMCIRKHSTSVFKLQEYVDRGITNQGVADLIREIAQKQESMLIAGSTYSGKTTLVNAFVDCIPDSERLFFIEQVHELLVQKPNVVMLECDPDQGVTAQHALMTAMRYSPHRIIVGELRGPEAINLLEACNTGHACYSTIHAESARDSLMRLEDLVMQAGRNLPYEAIRARVATSIRWVLHIGLVNGQRKINELFRVDGLDRGTQEYKFTNFSTGKPQGASNA